MLEISFNREDPEQDYLVPYQVEEARITFAYAWPNQEYQEEEPVYTPSRISVQSDNHLTPFHSASGDISPDYQNASPAPPPIPASESLEVCIRNLRSNQKRRKPQQASIPTRSTTAHLQGLMKSWYCQKPLILPSTSVQAVDGNSTRFSDKTDNVEEEDLPHL